MSIKIYDHDSKQWVKQGSSVASGIQIINTKNNYTSNNMEGCLDEIATSIQKVKHDVQYIYQNGTIGGGSGGASTPVVTIDGETQILVNSDDVIDIYYYFTSPNPGSGIANLTWGNNITKVTIPQSRNKWTVGPFPRGTWTCTISVQDKQGLWTVPAQVTVVSGSLELSSNFSDSKDFTLSDQIVINFDVTTEVTDAIFLTYNLNGKETTTPIGIGSNQLNLGVLPFLGVSKLTMKAYDSKYTSNVLTYTLVAADSTTLFTSTTFDSSQGAIVVNVGKNLMIDYRISMKNQYSFNTDYYIDGTKISTVTSNPGVNFWNVGNNLPLGNHTLQIITTTVDGRQSSSLNIAINVVSVGYVPYTHVTTGLLAAFDATGKLNNSSNQTIWEDTSNNNVPCQLYNFNYSSNGWIDNQDGEGTTLTLSGKSYAEINLKPFLNGIKYGFTLDILCKIKCVGDVDAVVLSCKNPNIPNQGFQINTWNVSMSTIQSQTVNTQIQDDTWTKVTYVIDRSNRLMIIYINGVISSVTYLPDNSDLLMSDNYTDEFVYNGTILLGCSKDLNNNIQHNSVSSIKNIRIYNRALTDDEVLQNYIADISDEDEQMAVRNLNTTTEGMPTLTLIGNFDQMDENSERTVQISYNDPNNPSKTFIKDGCLVSWQGTSSLNYPVKNYTIKLRNGGLPWITYAPTDNWKPEDRWTLKANYMDSSNSNNIGTNKFIYDFFKPYPYPSQVLDSATRENVDGFPIHLIINGEDMGIYTWNIDRYASNNYGFTTYNPDGTKNRNPNIVSYEIAVNSSSGAGAFKDYSWDSIRTEFECRYSYRGDDSAVTETILINGVNTKVLKSGMHQELIDLVAWVATCTDGQFLSDLGIHFSKRHLIDYYLIVYVFGMVDSLGKNMVLNTWGKDHNGNTIWYPSFYDCDTIAGLDNSGNIRFDAGLDTDNGDYNTSNSNLWTKLNRVFGEEIRQRYQELRLNRNINGVTTPPIFSSENIMSYIGDRVIETIGQKYYNYDARKKYLNPDGLQWLYMCNGTRKEFTKRWFDERFIYLDSVFEFNYTQNPVVIRSSKQGTLELNIKTYSPEWILVKFSDAANTSVKLRVGKLDFVNFSMTVNNATDNNIEIYGANNIMFINGLKDLNVRQLDLSSANKLVELDVSNSTGIQELTLGQNSYLTKVYCNNCSNLGLSNSTFQVNNRTLDLSNCTVLREFDCSNTHVANVIFNPLGGVIDLLNCSNTDITTFTLVGQEYLEGLSLNGCKSLSELKIQNCDGMTTINMSNTALSKIIINGCDNLSYLDISNTKALNTLDLSGCPNLKTLLMAGVSNPAITDLDLTYSLKLETLDISSSAYIQTLTFGQQTINGVLTNYNALKSLNCSNSTIKSIRYGKTNAAPSYFDLAGLNLNYLNLSGCSSIVDIRNINLTAASGSAPFNNCFNLTSIQGTVKLLGDITHAFYNCKNLVTLPTLDLSQATSGSEVFMYCNKFTMTHITNILVNSNISNLFTSQWRMFSSCAGLTGQLPSNLFSKCTGLTTLSEFFNGCTALNSTLPANLLQPLTNLTNCYYAFANTTITGEVPMNFLRYNTKLTTTERMFNNTKVTYAYLDNIFNYNSQLTNVYGMFSNCSSLQVAVTENMFLYNRYISSAGAFFSGSPGVTGTIPSGIFNNIPFVTGATSNKLANIEYFFAGTGVGGTIPAYTSPSSPGLLDNSPSLDSIAGLFSGCTNLSGSIPTDFLKYNNNISRAQELFNGCNGLTGQIPTNFLKGKTKLTNISRMFRGCSGLSTQIPIGFLDDCTLVTDVSELFYGCTELYGSIPARISTWTEGPSPIDPSIIIPIENVTQYGLFDKCSQIINASGVFCNCYNLRCEIPPTLLINATKVTSVDNLFYRCYYLYGPIPKNLFSNCVNLTSAVNVFRDCVELSEYTIDDDNPYAIPEQLFQNNFNLTNLSAAFYMWDSGLPHSPYLKGQIPPNLFSSCTKLNNISNMFTNCSLITGNLDDNLFKNNTKLANASYAFAITSITSLGPNLFSTCTVLKDMSYTFNGCSSLKGDTPLYWSSDNPVKASVTSGCFRGDTNLTNYVSIPSTWL